MKVSEVFKEMIDTSDEMELETLLTEHEYGLGEFIDNVIVALNSMDMEMAYMPLGLFGYSAVFGKEGAVILDTDRNEYKECDVRFDHALTKEEKDKAVMFIVNMLLELLARSMEELDKKTLNDPIMRTKLLCANQVWYEALQN